MKKKALITGITGQDGSYLAELLLDKRYDVHGIARRSSVDGHLQRVRHLISNNSFHLHEGDLLDIGSLEIIIKKVMPDEVYNLASQSQVGVSFKQPSYTKAVNFNGLANLLELIRDYAPNAKVYQASTSEMFGNSPAPQNEDTPLDPQSPYAEAKVKSQMLCNEYRSNGMFVSCGILFNHESPRRGVEFVTRKITDTVAKMKNGKENVLVLGNLDAKRDWGHAKDYVEAMWRMLQQDKPDDYVIATGKTRSVRELLDIAFRHAELEYTYVNMKEFSVEDADLGIGMLRKLRNGKYYIVSHPEFYRPTEVHELCGDYSKAKTILGWEPKTGFDELIKDMYESGLKR